MKILEIIGIVSAVIVVFIIIGLLYFLPSVIKNSTATGKAKKHCDEYKKLACELQPPKGESSPILGGTFVQDGILPHLVFVLTTITTCTGSLISEYFVLTAAHCVRTVTLRENEVRVMLGSVNNENATVFKVDEIHVHPDYVQDDESTKFNDIALFKLAKKVEFNWKTRPICLNTDFGSISTTNITTSGWGIDGTENSTNLLRTVETYIDGEMLTICSETYDKKFNTLMVCAGHPTKQKSACEGDSGGPMQIPLNDGCPNTYEVIAVTQSGTSCMNVKDGELLIGLNSKVEFHLRWIVDIVWP